MSGKGMSGKGKGKGKGQKPGNKPAIKPDAPSADEEMGTVVSPIIITPPVEVASGVSVTSSSEEHKEDFSSPEESSETLGSGETWAAPIAKPDKTAFMRVFSGPRDRAHNIKNQGERAFTEETLALHVPEKLILSITDLPPQFVTAKDQLYRNLVNSNFFRVVGLGLCVATVASGVCVLDPHWLWVVGLLVAFVFMYV